MKSRLQQDSLIIAIVALFLAVAIAVTGGRL